MGALKRLGLAVVVVTLASVWGCAEAPVASAQLSITFSPSSIDDQGQASMVTVEATTEFAKAGTGTVTLSTEVGSLAAGQALTLDARGQATASFSCPVALDPGCSREVKVSAIWKRSGAGTIASSRVLRVIAASDGGTSGSNDAGMAADCLMHPNALVFEGAAGGTIYQGSLVVTDGGFTISGALEALSVKVLPTAAPQGTGWECSFVSPTTLPLVVGPYLDAGSTVSRRMGQPGLYVGALNDNTGKCPTIGGNFRISRLSSFSDGGIAEFAATFEQLCNGLPGNRLRGCVHFTQ